MQNTPIRRYPCVFLVCQPVFWMSPAALARALPAGASPPGSVAGTAPAFPVTAAPGDTEVVRAENGVISSMAPAPTAVDAPLDPDAYICGTGDALELSFWGVQNSKLRVTIDLEGRAFISKIGYLQLRGKHVGAAEIRERTDPSDALEQRPEGVPLNEGQSALREALVRPWEARLPVRRGWRRGRAGDGTDHHHRPLQSGSTSASTAASHTIRTSGSSSTSRSQAVATGSRSRSTRSG